MNNKVTRTLGPSIIKNMLTGKEVMRAGKGLIRAGRGYNNIDNMCNKI